MGENDMKEWTRKRKADIVMGIILQVYFLVPWIHHHTMYGYLYQALKMNDYVRTYNEMLLPSLKKIWGYTKPTAFVFLCILFLMLFFQIVEFMRLYHIFINERPGDYRGFFWILFMIAFAVFNDGFTYEDAIEYSLYPVYGEIYMILLLVLVGVWIILDALLDTWESEHTMLLAELEEQEKKALQTKVQILEERYQEMLKSRKVVHDMKNHILALKNYDQEQNWSGLHEYLNELSEDILEYNFHVWTGNHMLDMILNQKEKDAQRQKTDMQIDTEVFTTLPFTDREIISLFGNLLDNALEACEQIKGKERWIRIKIKKKNQLIYIEIANAIAKKPGQNGSGFISTKKENGLHGYGMRNIRDIADYGYTLDGDTEGEIQYENFNACKADFVIKGFNVHPGSSKDTMINASLVAMEINNALPSMETPRGTEDYEGFYHLMSMSGEVAEAELHYIVRDHDKDLFEAKKKTLKLIEKDMNEKWGEGTVTLTISEQYRNMAEIIATCMHLIDNAKKACENADVAPLVLPIRGGTDGCQLSFKGLPCPNLGTGGHAYHGPYEHITVEGMDKSVDVVTELVKLYAM